MPDKDAGRALVARILSLLGTDARNELAVGGRPVAELVERFGSPLYVHDAAGMRERLELVSGAFGARVGVLYSIKANPLLAVCQVFAQARAGAEVASCGELIVARKAGFPAARLQFAGPGKSDEDLLLAINEGIDAINVESEAEFDAIARLTAEHGQTARLALRMNAGSGRAGARLSMRGAASKFGVAAEQAESLVRRILENEQLDFVGLHCYSGTQCFDADAWLAEASFLLALANELETASGCEVTSLNFGGGFGVPCFAGDSEFALDRAAEGLQALIDEDARPQRRYVIELGRYLVAPFGVYLAKVLYKKQMGEREIVILDGGLHHHGAAAGQGSVLRRAFPVVAASKLRAEPTHDYVLAGPLCTPRDRFDEHASLPVLEKGDLVAILQSGAYGLSYSNTKFLSHPTPAEVVVSDASAWLARERCGPEDHLKGQRLLGMEC